MADLIKTDIYNYSDYRMYLKDVYKANRGAGSAANFFDLLVRRGGFMDKAVVFVLFNDVTTSLSVMHCMQLSRALEHSDKEAEYFRCLVALSQASHEKEVRYFKKMRREIVDRNSATTEMVEKNREEFYTEWHHSVVRALIGISGRYGNEHEHLEKKLLVPVRENKIKESVQLLSRLGFIKKDKSGNYLIATEKNIKTGQEFSWEEKKRIHLQYLKLAKDVLLEDHVGQNKVSSHVIGISRKTYEKICRYTDELKKRIGTLIENEEETDRVYLYQLIFVPLTKDCSAE